MKTPKQLLPIGGIPAIRLCAETLLADGMLRRLVVAISPETPVGVRHCLEGLPVEFAVNETPEEGMASSVTAAMKVIGRQEGGILIHLSDSPLVTPRTVSHMISTYRRQGRETILIPTHGGRAGHPAIFPSRLLEGLEAGKTLRAIRDENPAAVFRLPVEDEAILWDMDTIEDYRKMLARADARIAKAAV